jgi:MOSC domain-containing protein YiiM
MSPQSSPRVVALNVVHGLRPDATNGFGVTSIDKRPIDGPVRATALGLAGDTQSDKKYHGGPDQALYAYAREDARWWEAELGREIGPGQFGENVSTEAIDITGAVLGERWHVGGAVLQVRDCRIPCATFQNFWEVPHLVRRFTQHGAPGAYLSVAVEGDMTAGDVLEVRDRPAHGVTVGELFRALTTQPTLAERVLEAARDLPDAVVKVLRRKARAAAKSAAAAGPA